MSYLFDSDRTIGYLDGSPTAQGLFAELAPVGISISIVTYIEVFEGTLDASDPAAAQGHFAEFVAPVPILPISEDVARRCTRAYDTICAGRGAAYATARSITSSPRRRSNSTSRS